MDAVGRGPPHSNLVFGLDNSTIAGDSRSLFHPPRLLLMHLLLLRVLVGFL